ncbi:MAG: hypothetical protein Q8Q08_03835 [Candidatus Omnitrophota bacterium]|nr:hypothetical protein [Candidatus Omnitrophota bacterium]MDZ4243044.1 hypothetical protein [Candidatus Omnitrophota bacterium]
MIVRSNRKGVVFVAALAIMTVLITLGMGYLSNMRTEILIANNYRSALKALYNSESAVEHSIAEIRSGTDPDGDGLGNIPSQDLDYDGINDYYALYSAPSLTVTGSGGVPDGAGARTINAKVKQVKWTGAVESGTSPTMNIGNSGVINGNVEGNSTAAIQPQVTVNGSVLAPKPGGVSIPTVSFPAYQAIADYAYSGWPTWNTNPLPGIHYVAGNLTISGINNFNLDGSIIVTGVIQISSISGSMTITPTGNNPAIVAGSSLTMTATWKPLISGLVYAGTSMSLSSITGPSFFNGSLVARTGDLTMQFVNNFTVNYNPDLDPPHFSAASGGPIVISSWQGH